MRVMTWSHIQKRIASVLHEWIEVTIEVTLFNVSSKHRVVYPPLPPAFLSANSNPILAGAGSVFNLAGTVDEPIVGLMQRGVSPGEALELLPFYVDQAERILDQTEEMMRVSEKVLQSRNPIVHGADREQAPKNSKRPS